MIYACFNARSCFEVVIDSKAVVVATALGTGCVHCLHIVMLKRKFGLE